MASSHNSRDLFSTAAVEEPADLPFTAAKKEVKEESIQVDATKEFDVTTNYVVQVFGESLYGMVLYNTSINVASIDWEKDHELQCGAWNCNSVITIPATDMLQIKRTIDDDRARHHTFEIKINLDLELPPSWNTNCIYLGKYRNFEVEKKDRPVMRPQRTAAVSRPTTLVVYTPAEDQKHTPSNHKNFESEKKDSSVIPTQTAVTVSTPTTLVANIEDQKPKEEKQSNNKFVVMGSTLGSNIFKYLMSIDDPTDWESSYTLSDSHLINPVTIPKKAMLLLKATIDDLICKNDRSSYACIDIRLWPDSRNGPWFGSYSSETYIFTHTTPFSKNPWRLDICTGKITKISSENTSKVPDTKLVSSVKNDIASLEHSTKQGGITHFPKKYFSRFTREKFPFKHVPLLSQTFEELKKRATSPDHLVELIWKNSVTSQRYQEWAACHPDDQKHTAPNATAATSTSKTNAENNATQKLPPKRELRDKKCKSQKTDLADEMSRNRTARKLKAEAEKIEQKKAKDLAKKERAKHKLERKQQQELSKSELRKELKQAEAGVKHVVERLHNKFQENGTLSDQDYLHWVENHAIPAIIICMEKVPSKVDEAKCLLVVIGQHCNQDRSLRFAPRHLCTPQLAGFLNACRSKISSNDDVQILTKRARELKTTNTKANSSSTASATQAMRSAIADTKHVPSSQHTGITVVRTAPTSRPAALHRADRPWATRQTDDDDLHEVQNVAAKGKRRNRKV